jgi:anti-sigma factor RsiW
MERLTPELLQRYSDRELGEREHRLVEAHLAGCPEDRAALERLRALASLLREAREVQLEGVSFDGFSARVMDGVRRQERPGALERLGVWLGEFLEHQRRFWIPATAVAGAAAAVLVVLPLLGGPPGVPQAGGFDSQIAVYGHAGAPATGAGAGSEIVSVVGARQWERFQVAGDAGESMAVAWIRE